MDINKYKNDRMYKGYSLTELPKDYVIIDIETTGLSPYTNEIIEIAAVKYHDGIKVDTFSSLIKPNKKIPKKLQKLQVLQMKWFKPLLI